MHRMCIIWHHMFIMCATGSEAVAFIFPNSSSLFSIIHCKRVAPNVFIFQQAAERRCPFRRGAHRRCSGGMLGRVDQERWSAEGCSAKRSSGERCSAEMLRRDARGVSKRCFECREEILNASMPKYFEGMLGDAQVCFCSRYSEWIWWISTGNVKSIIVRWAQVPDAVQHFTAFGCSVQIQRSDVTFQFNVQMQRSDGRSDDRSGYRVTGSELLSFPTISVVDKAPTMWYK